MLTSRQYAGDHDAAVMAEIAMQATAASPTRSYWHSGDVWWGIYHNPAQDPSQMVRIWYEDTRPVAFGYLRMYGELSWAILPDYHDPVSIGRVVLDWGEQQIATLALDNLSRLRVPVIEGDETREALLRDRGYRRGSDDAEAYFAFPLDGTISGSVLPDGFDVRHVDGESEWEARVHAHREVWHPSAMTLEAYRRLRTLPSYQPELDLIVTGPDAEIAAYCTVWWDERSRTGEFEPVGTREKYRGKGLGRSLVREGLRRLQARGARYALVYTPRSNGPAVALYKSCGFHVTGDAYLWKRPDAKDSAYG